MTQEFTPSRELKCLIDIAFSAENLMETHRSPADDSSRVPDRVVEWANEFNTLYAGADWTAVEYADAVDAFTRERYFRTLAMAAFDRPAADKPQVQRGAVQLPADIHAAMLALIDYAWQDESSNYYSVPFEERAGHLFEKLQRLRDWLEVSSARPDPRCVESLLHEIRLVCEDHPSSRRHPTHAFCRACGMKDALEDLLGPERFNEVWEKSDANAAFYKLRLRAAGSESVQSMSGYVAGPEGEEGGGEAA